MMAPCLFATKLPAELRLLIYAEVFGHTPIFSKRAIESTAVLPKVPTAILAANKLARAEAIEAPYKKCTFRLDPTTLLELQQHEEFHARAERIQIAGYVDVSRRSCPLKPDFHESIRVAYGLPRVRQIGVLSDGFG